jgi:anti-sigma B factor antagonist
VRPSADLGPPQPEHFLTVEARHRGDNHVVLDVTGHVDAFTAPLLRACLQTQLSRTGLRELILDVGGVESMGAAGVSAIVEASRGARERHLPFRLRAHGLKAVLRPLQLAGVLDGFEVGAAAARIPVGTALAHA